jgi:uncharacterized membrane protein YsdA (DUF1294 family)
MFFDKNAAKQGNRRIPEKSLWLFTFLGGSLGILLGMKAPLFHKAAKPIFKIGVPAILISQILITFYFLYQYGFFNVR